MSIFNEIKRTGIKYSSHESDLYIPVNEKTSELIKTYVHRRNVTIFKNQVEGGLWYEVPFAYDPWWKSRLHTIKLDNGGTK